ECVKNDSTHDHSAFQIEDVRPPRFGHQRENEGKRYASEDKYLRNRDKTAEQQQYHPAQVPQRRLHSFALQPTPRQQSKGIAKARFKGLVEDSSKAPHLHGENPDRVGFRTGGRNPWKEQRQASCSHTPQNQK